MRRGEFSDLSIESYLEGRSRHYVFRRFPSKRHEVIRIQAQLAGDRPERVFGNLWGAIIELNGDDERGRLADPACKLAKAQTTAFTALSDDLTEF